MKFIHNNSGQVKNYAGTDIQDSSTYQIPESMDIKYHESDDLISDISSGDVSISLDGSTVPESISEQIDILKNNMVKHVSISETKPFLDAQGFRARFTGFEGTAIAGEVTNLDFNITEERFINGLRMVVCDQKFGDKVSMQVIDKSYVYAGVLYPSDYEGIPWNLAQPDGVILDEFGKDWFISSDSQCQEDVVTPYPARLLPGMTVRIVYTSTGGTDVKFKANLYLHWKAE